MIRYCILITGSILLAFQYCFHPLPLHWQLIIFFTGIIILGIPHGAADLLVANQQAVEKQKKFSNLFFHLKYNLKLFIFASFIWFFPLTGNIIFLFFAAWHFGETDLTPVNAGTLSGKIVIVSYGLLILACILLVHFEEVLPLVHLADSKGKYNWMVDVILNYRYHLIITITGILIISSLYYFSTNAFNKQVTAKLFLQYTLMLLILCKLPLLLGFTFYFVFWHSILSLQNIIGYLRKGRVIKTSTISSQISLYSILAIGAVIIFGLMGFMFFNLNSMLLYVFLGLAVLTAPHMEVMHEMYCSIRKYAATD